MQRSPMSANPGHRHITLSDGRRLAFAQCGDPDGRPVFFFHASGSSRLNRPAEDSIMLDLGIRFITTDRPGHGFSDPQPGRTLLDWPDDVSQLAQHLGIERFFVMGWSAGGPHALACAHQLHVRVLAGAVVAGVAPPERPRPYQGLPAANRLLAFGARRATPLVYLLRSVAYRVLRGQPDHVAKRIAQSFAPVDRPFLREPEEQRQFIADLREGYRQGWRGPAWDDIILNRPWGFLLEDIPVRIDFWQGDMDANVPLGQAEYQHARIPSSRLTVWSGQGHLYPLQHWAQVLSSLVEGA